MSDRLGFSISFNCDSYCLAWKLPASDRSVRRNSSFSQGGDLYDQLDRDVVKSESEPWTYFDPNSGRFGVVPSQVRHPQRIKIERLCFGRAPTESHHSATVYQHKFLSATKLSVTAIRRVNAPYPIPNCEANDRSAILVLGSGTTREPISAVTFLCHFSQTILDTPGDRWVREALTRPTAFHGPDLAKQYGNSLCQTE